MKKDKNDVTRQALMWLQGNNTGISSRAMCLTFLSETPVSNNATRDPIDSGGCIRRLDWAPKWWPQPRGVRYAARVSGTRELPG